ncbi:autotransporter-associated beta strand repeat-containing protein [Roseimicrobium sp. ORNL1]|uniref:beta strand repeat-containing protein n=1 Tax=Roseimicrobium sp. ORNL1 TaxID=2711231 RepID=UPI0013E15059|nr:autotransporter-associated beta strand repeat-containing protein [Roseimicrobium sp. ORNL1]QIF01631.1 PEP-CTERM sorting domain-containing protein [Roseimicrobium sp. ORNL1]
MKKTALALILALLALPIVTDAQTYQFDGDLSSQGTIQNGPGNWSTNSSVSTNLRWLKDGVYTAWDNSGLAIAEFGSTTSVNGGAITVDGEVLAAGLNFTALGTPLGTSAYSFTGGTINLGTGGVINVANGASGGGTGGQWVTFGSQLKGSNLTIQKSGGSTVAFVRLTVANPNLTGTLTLKSAPGATSGIYLSVGSPTFISSLSGIDVQATSIFNPTGTGTYTVPISIAGVGTSNYGAVRVDASNTTFSGTITLKADARFHTHINTLNTTITGSITESGGSYSFQRTANSPTNTTTPLNTTYTGASNYTGATVFGRTLAITSSSESGGTEGGVNILDFTSATAPDTNILYNNVTPGALQLIGGLASRTELRLHGAAGEDNSQTFGSTSAQQSATAITLVSGFGGTMNANLGELSRTGDGALAIKGPVEGKVTGSVFGATEGLVGTWATYSSADGKTAGWAGLKDGVVGVFDGDLDYQTGVAAHALPGATITSQLRVSGASSGDVVFESAFGITDLASISMTDTVSNRKLGVDGESLRVGLEGGIQIVAGARSLSVGTQGQYSMLTAGDAWGSSGQLALTNMSSDGVLTIHSMIADNGPGLVSLNVNGTGKTVLTAANSYTGLTIINSGVLEVRHSDALGATGATSMTKIMTGASLNLSGGITLGETIQANGHGIASDGAIRNLSGVNTITPSVRLQSSTRFTSDSGTLVLAGGFTTQISATAYTFSGSGDFEVRGPITATSGILNKEGGGTLTLIGASNAVGVTTVTDGTLHLNFDGAGAPASNILYSGAAISATVGSVTLGGGALKLTGKANSASSQALGALTLSSGFSRISAISTGSGSMDTSFLTFTRTVGGTARFDLPAIGTIKTTSGTDNAILTGTGGVAYATVGASDWAATSTAVSGSRNIVGLSTINGYTNSTATSLSGNADIASGITDTALSASSTISSLRFNQAQATTITQPTPPLTNPVTPPSVVLTTGGILVTPNVGANVSAIRGGGIRAAVGSTDLVIFQNNTAAPLTISSRILNTTTTGGVISTTGLTKAGAGTLVLEFDTGYIAGDYTGDTRIQDGSLQLVRTTATSISYYLYASTNFILGSGSTSGKLILGNVGGNSVTQYGGLLTQGSGTANSLVGASTSYSTFLHYVSGVHDFRKGFIGGSGTNEDNLNLTISLGTLQLGTSNTFKGKTTLLQNTIEVTKLANRGVASSLGTGDATSTSHIIDMATATTASQNFNVIATLAYIGDTNSVTDRPINVSNGDIPGDVVSVTAVLENNGTGTVKFTSPFTAAGSNTVQRVLRLGGTNAGDNEIVSFMDVNASITSKVEKTGVGSWTLTGGSTYSGGTSVQAGTLLVANDLGSGTGSGNVTVAKNAVFGGRGMIQTANDRSVTLTGATLQVGLDLPGKPSSSASILTIMTGTGGQLSLSDGSTITLDLFDGAGEGDTTGMTGYADMLVVSGSVAIAADTTIAITDRGGMTDWAIGDAWQLFEWSGLTVPLPGTTSANFVLPTLSADLAWDTTEIFTTGILRIEAAVVPEPSRALLVLGGSACLLFRRRRSVA